MADLYTRYGYRSPNQGTYWSAFKWTADVFNIEYSECYRLDDAINKLKNNNYLKIIKIMPINYNLKSNLEKESILNSYKLFLKTFNFNIQIIIKSQKQDLSNHIIKIINSQKKESQIIKNISNKYLENIEKIKLISKSDSKQFFIIINQPQENNKEEICIDQLNEKYLKIKEGLLRCGNIVTNVNNEKETKEIIRNYIFLNDDENRM